MMEVIIQPQLRRGAGAGAMTGGGGKNGGGGGGGVKSGGTDVLSIACANYRIPPLMTNCFCFAPERRFQNRLFEMRQSYFDKLLLLCVQFNKLPEST
jgi:hypothetical protein